MISNFEALVYRKNWKGIWRLHLMVINNNWTKKDGTAHRKSMELGLQITDEQWGHGNDRSAWLIGNDEDSINKNLMIRKVIQKLEAVYFKLKGDSGREPRADEIVEAYRKSLEEKEARPRKKLLDFIPDYISDMKLVGNTADVYNYSLRSALSNFLKTKLDREDIYLDEIDDAFMYRFEIYMSKAQSKKGKPFKRSTAIEYVNKLVAIVNHAKKEKYITKDPLQGYDVAHLLKGEKPKHVITSVHEAVFWKIRPDELHKIETVNVQGHAVRGDTETATGNQFNYDLVRIRLLVLLQSWTGLAFADLEKYGKDIRHLIMMDLSGKKSFIYNRAKNGELAVLPLFDQAEKILEALEYNAAPLCSYDTLNRKIKALLRYYVIDQPEETVTHLGRHLFGSRMLAMGFTMEAVSRMMGHQSITETEKTYARVDMTKIQADFDKIKISSAQQLGQAIAI
jgi:integrase